MKINERPDCSYLFSSLKTNDGMSNLYSAITDQKTIKSGSYGKLMKSYFKEMSKSESTSKTDSSKKETKTDSSKKEEKVSRKSDTLDKLLSSSKNNQPYTKDATYAGTESEGKLFDSTL